MLSEIDSWIFDLSRKEGDCEVIEINGGCAVLLFEGSGLPAFKASAYDDIMLDKNNTHVTRLSDSSPVLFDDTVLQLIPA